jgi:hypothetical protein
MGGWICVCVCVFLLRSIFRFLFLYSPSHLDRMGLFFVEGRGGLVQKLGFWVSSLQSGLLLREGGGWKCVWLWLDLF